MGWVCDNCKKGKHKDCSDRNKCHCGHCLDSKVVKWFAVLGGAAAIVGGTVLTVATGGLAGPLVGAAIVGSGLSSTIQGGTKLYTNEDISAGEFLVDVGVGALTGLATGGVGAAGNLAMSGVKQGAVKLAARVGTGVVAGAASKGIDDIKNACQGKEVDSSLSAWGTSMMVGGIGGAGTHLSSNLTKGVDGVAKSVTRVAISTGTGATGDALCQGVNMATGKQENYDWTRTVKSGGTACILSGVQEGTKNGVYRAYGGKDNLMHEQANRRAMGKAPEKDRDAVKNAHDNLKKIPKEMIDTERAKVDQYQSRREQIDSEIKETRAAQKTQQTAEGRQKLGDLKQQATTAKENFKKSADFMNKDNAHMLIDKKAGQMAADINQPSGAQNRGANRAVFDVEKKPDGSGYRYPYAGSTSNHQYDEVPSYKDPRSKYYGYKACAETNVKNNMNTQEQMAYSKNKTEEEEEQRKRRKKKA